MRTISDRTIIRKFMASLDEGGWRDYSACRGEDPALWDIPDEDMRQATVERREEVTAMHRAARAICRQCPVRGECLEEALDTPGLQATIRGALDPDELHAERRRKYRARAAGRPYELPAPSVFDNYALAI